MDSECICNCIGSGFLAHPTRFLKLRISNDARKASAAFIHVLEPSQTAFMVMWKISRLLQFVRAEADCDR